ncbi:MAG: hypothetical protein K2J97_00910 [Muribaculaceae bacterium]|nr:hypothetical protein [Muribaculaceae bacterium]
MNDDKLKELFADYKPDIQSDATFMARLERSLRAVEFIKERKTAAKRRNRVAMAVACAAGFLAGGLFFSVMPYITQWFSGQNLTNVSPSFQPGQLAEILTYCLGCISTMALTLASYDIALGLVGRTNVHSK